MTDTENWREKYRSLALELERCEHSHANLLEQLRSCAMQLSLAVHGQNAQLDQIMTQLTTQLNAGKLEQLRTLLRESEKHIRALDETRASTAQQWIARLQEWASLLQQQDSCNAHTDTFRSFEQQLSHGAESCHALPELIGTLLEVQKTLGDTPAPTRSSDDLAQQEGLVGARLATRLLELIQLLNIPPQHAARTHALIKRLEAGPSTGELEACLSEVTELARLCGSSSESDIQEYLLDLNKQLAYLHSFLDRNAEAEAKQRKRNNLLDQTVRADVQKINHSVKHSTDIHELKQAVHSQLVGIIKAMNDYKAEESQRHEAFKSEQQALLERLESMEKQTDLFRKRAEEAHLKSKTDPLTGLANRFGYDQQLANELERFQRYGTTFSLCVADIDFFKRINDEYGHLAGDKVLRLMARILRANLRNVDFIARFGGEEFVILMPSTDGPSAHTAAEKVRVAVEQSPFNFQSKPVQITVSFGIAEVRSDDSSETLFGRADACLYEAKRSGRNRVVLS